MNINIVIPENCEAETITVVYKFKPAVKPVEKLTSGELAFIDSRPLKNNGKPTEKWSCKTCGAEFDSIRSCGQHSRHCGKKISKHGRFTPDQVAYLMEHWDEGDHKAVAQHLGFTAKKCSDKYGSEIRFDDQVLFGLPEKPVRIFVGSTMELFGHWIQPNWWDFIIQSVSLYPQHTFIFLTKKPENLPQEWPVNCWVGVSVPTQWSFGEAVERLARVHSSVKFLSFEPLFDRIYARPTLLIGAGVNWVILGRETPFPKREHLPWQWFKEVVEAADSAGIPIFLKDNLSSLLPAEEPFYKFIRPTPGATAKGYLRQEFPA